MKLMQFPIGCTGKDSQINDCHQRLPKLMMATLIDENVPVDNA
jgi:hypothetical protein